MAASGLQMKRMKITFRLILRNSLLLYLTFCKNLSQIQRINGFFTLMALDFGWPQAAC